MDHGDSRAAQQVDKWLLKQGYPLEMYVAQELRSAGFDVVQSSYYQGQQSEPWREIDVLASRQIARGNRESPIQLLRVILAIECKFSPDAPWGHVLP